VNQSDVQILFKELETLPIHSDISAAYSETIKAMRDSDITIDDLQDVLVLFKINPFEHVQVIFD
jgi:hypothetical protein